MNDGFKQRLVGALVLGSLVLILWPIVFSQTIGPVVDKRSQIPDAPSFEKYTVPRPSRPANIDPIVEVPADEVEAELPVETVAKQGESTVKSPPLEETQKPIKKPTLDKKGLPVSWTLQVASFSKESNAMQMTKALKEKGYKAYMQRIKKRGIESNRVYVGPKLTQAALLKDKKAIDESFNVQSLVVRFTQ